MKTQVLGGFILLVILAGCTQNQTQLPNPASTNCIDLGYQLEIREGSLGQYGVCIFPDETECGEWALFRGECSPGEIEKIECSVPEDCEGKVHILCVGEWKCLTGACSWECAEERSGYIDVAPEEAKELIDENPGLIIIDVSPAYDDGHLPGAINYYAGDGSLDKAIPSLDKEATYLVYCHVDSVSILGAQKLIDAGFTKVYRLKGNYRAWVDAGYEIEK